MEIILAEEWRHQDGFVWLDSLKPEASKEPITEGLSIIAHKPEFLLEGKAHQWPLLEKKLAEKKLASHSSSSGAAIGFFRYDGSFCFGFYETTVRSNSSQREKDLKKKRAHSNSLTSLFHTHHYETPSEADDCKEDDAFGQELHLSYHPRRNSNLPRQASASNNLQQIQHEISGLRKSSPQKIPFASHLSKEKYCAMVRKAQQEIAAGNIYQVCLAHRFEIPFEGDPWPLYLQLRQTSPAPFAAYLKFNKETILSTSPECFLKIDDRHILTRPIKGTRPRHSSPEADLLQARELQQSLKENAELIMITDLERNDLGKICNYGSVVTSQLVHLEPYPHVFHLISTVEGLLRPEISHVAAVAACFPGGSISGAPKKMAMKIIDQLESVPRGLFTGSIGYFGYNGHSQFNIAIRTMTISNGIASFHVGAGITSDSIPEEEWQETLDKAQGFLNLKS